MPKKEFLENVLFCCPMRFIKKDVLGEVISIPIEIFCSNGDFKRNGLVRALSAVSTCMDFYTCEKKLVS